MCQRFLNLTGPLRGALGPYGPLSGRALGVDLRGLGGASWVRVLAGRDHSFWGMGPLILGGWDHYFLGVGPLILRDGTTILCPLFGAGSILLHNIVVYVVARSAGWTYFHGS